MPDFDVDFFVMGGGSGGVRAARVAAGHGARAALAAEYRVGGQLQDQHLFHLCQRRCHRTTQADPRGGPHLPAVVSESAEFIQLAAVALRMGVIKRQLDGTLAFHPTVAEELVTLRSSSH